jgi:transcriptional regulator with XRE-family HTH domain
MIKNARQYEITKAQIENFRAALRRFHQRQRPENVDPLMYKAFHDGMASQLATLERELTEFDQLRSGKIDIAELSGQEELPRALIKARIARRLTYKELAMRVGVSPQQLRRWEEEDYDDLDPDRMIAIARALGLAVPVQPQVKAMTEPTFTIETAPDFMPDLVAIARTLAAEASRPYTRYRPGGVLHEPVTGVVAAAAVLTTIGFKAASSALEFLSAVEKLVKQRNGAPVAVTSADGRTLLTIEPNVSHTTEDFARAVAGASPESEKPV